MASPRDTTRSDSGLIEEWLPNTFTSVSRQMGAKDSQLRGVRLPLSEEQTRRIANKYRCAPPSGLPYGWEHMQWCLWQSAVQYIDKLDAVSAWQNEGGQ